MEESKSKVSGEKFTERMVLVFDVGTQSSRALLVNNRGEIKAKATEKHDPPYISPETDWAGWLLL